MQINKPILLIILLISFIFPALFWNTHFAWDEVTFQKQALGIKEGKTIEEIKQFNVHPLMYPQLVSIFYLWFPEVPEEMMSHAISTVLGSLVVLFTFLLARTLYNEEVGLIASALMALLPLRVLMSRMFMLDIAETFFFLCTIYFLFKFVEVKSKKYFIMLFLFTSGGMLFKFPGTLLALPLIFITLLRHFEIKKVVFYIAILSPVGVVLLLVPTFFGGSPPIEFYGSYVNPDGKDLDWILSYFKYFFMSVTPLILVVFPALFIGEEKRLKITLPLIIAIFILISYNFDYLYETTYKGPYNYVYTAYNSLYFSAILMFSMLLILIFYALNEKDRFLAIWFIFILIFHIVTLGVRQPAEHPRRLLIAFPALIILASVGIWKIKQDFKIFAAIISSSLILVSVFLSFNVNMPTSLAFDSYYQKDNFLNQLNSTGIVQHQFIPGYYSNTSFITIPNDYYEFKKWLDEDDIKYIVYSGHYAFQFKNWGLEKNSDIKPINVIETSYRICDPMWFRFWINNTCVNRTVEKLIIYEITNKNNNS